MSGNSFLFRTALILLLAAFLYSPVTRAETNCADGLDNDTDSLIDCDDPSCDLQTCDDGDLCSPESRCIAGACEPFGTLCGDLTLDLLCGESCDPPNGEICNTPFDEDGDGLISCEDPDCCQLATGPTCGADCQLVPPCQPILQDPSVIRFDKVGTRDFFKIYGRIPISLPINVNPVDDGFSVVLTNSNGVIYSATLGPNDLVDRGRNRYLFKDKTAKIGPGFRNGLASVSVRIRKIAGQWLYTFRLKAYGDFSAATEPFMTTQIIAGDYVGILPVNWTPTRRGWILRVRDVITVQSTFLCHQNICADGFQNGDETGIDCGGSCPVGCPPGGGCFSGADCDSGVCLAGICQIPSCTDNTQNGIETGVDCGGNACPACNPGQGCNQDSDCISMNCDGFICQAPSCATGLNGDGTASYFVQCLD